jgi:hypothetical protein
LLFPPCAMRLCAFLAAGLVAVSLGCGAHDATTRTTPRGPVGGATTTAGTHEATDDEAPLDDHVMVGLRVHGLVAALCAIPLPEAYVEFDASDEPPEASHLFDALTKCLLAGALRGRAVRVIGYVGTAEAEPSFGKSRAASVASHLRRRGIARTQLVTMASGSAEVSPLDGAPPEYDQRVEIRLR